ncbi:MAG: hypothetical protein HZA15_09795 [Nitrospirae bacterium]|nr:hypothetical protein [Nitrospirota bacterium]
MRKHMPGSIMLVLMLIFLCSCATSGPIGTNAALLSVERGEILRNFKIDPSRENQILALDPEQVTGREIREVLAGTPAPYIMNIHGGIYPVHLAMESFSRFLIRMGYPREALKNPGDGSYSYSCYNSSEKLAGVLAWHYEHEGMRPMIVGHSQGGMQAVKVLYAMTGNFGDQVNVWNPVLDKEEERQMIVDPITGIERPVVGLKLSYVSAVGAGGLTRLLPNQWSMAGKLRKIPDSVEEFTGFSIGVDFWGGDLFGLSTSNLYQANGKASVRNVKLPGSYNHVIIPVTSHLAKTEAVQDWINAYTPVEEPQLNVEFETDTRNILWAADVWYSIKKHWVLELKQLIEAKQRLQHAQIP